MTRRADGAVWPIDRLIAAYLFLTGAAFFFPHRPANWPLLAALHVAGIVLLMRWGVAGRTLDAAGSRFGRVGAFLHHWYPLLLMPLLYTELTVLNVAVHGGVYFDPLISAWEELVFGGQPSRDWAVAAGSAWLSESLHAAYISYYLIIYGPPLVLFVMNRRPEFRTMVLAMMATFLMHYLFFVYFPVQGPRYDFPSPVPEAGRGPVWALTHQILDAGASRGAAFPSSHVGVAFAQTLSVYFIKRSLAPAMAILSLGLAAGAVYGGFHYLIDAVCGLVLGTAITLLVWYRVRDT